MHIFRAGRQAKDSGGLVAQLLAGTQELLCSPSLQSVISCLLRAGELECAFEDIACPDADRAAQLTDCFASAAIAWDAGRRDVRRLASLARELLEPIRGSRVVTVTTCEGFAYYALHPLDYADLVSRAVINEAQAFVIGIRSIATTLSAVVAAKLGELGVGVERTTVRPAGHPYDRRCEFDPLQAARIRAALDANPVFLICDEGPGRSGSSILSVAEALDREGVSQDRILLLCSHEPDTRALCAPHASHRWSRYRVLASGLTRRLPSEAGEYAGGGEWRKRFIMDRQAWPASWPQMEPLKYVSADGKCLLKFEGHGDYGGRVRFRNEALAASGYGAPYYGQSLGFGRHVLRQGHMGRHPDLTFRLLARFADYCAWRAKNFATTDSNGGELETMACKNFNHEFGVPLELHLPIEKPVIADGRMQPHEWFCTVDGRWLKLDAATHGEDHFFPGPCDIAWDLAGVIVEWGLDPAACDAFLSAYSRLSGDDARSRIDDYVTAYASFRIAWSKVAAGSVADAQERDRLLQDYRRYRAVAEAHKDRCPIGCKTPRYWRPLAAARPRPAQGT